MKTKKTHATGGEIGQAMTSAAPMLNMIPGVGTALGVGAGAFGTLLQVMDAQNEKKKTVYGSPGNYATGGDMQLSSSSFQVKGNANTTDGNSYNMGNTSVKLDHNEVVKDNKFVYSDDLTNVLSGNSFAEDAAKIEKSTGKIEKRGYPDAISSNTIKRNEVLLQDLAMVQEKIAALKGLRNQDGSTKQHFATGGPLPWEGFDVSAFQNWANQNGAKLSLTGWGPKTEAVWNQVGDQWATSIGMKKDPLSGVYTRTPITIANNPGGMSVPNKDGTYNNISMRDAFGQPNPTVKAGMAIPTTNLQPLPNKYMTLQENLPYAQGTALNPAIPFNERSYTAVPGEAYQRSDPSVANATTVAASTVPTDDNSYMPESNYRVPFTWGDAMQATEVAQKFVGAFQPVEKEPTRLNETPITKESYDPASQLQQNQRTYQNMLNTTSGSANTRRAVANQLYSRKLNADGQTITQYDQMQQRANTQYEQLLGQRRESNIAKETYSADVNSRNRAAKFDLIDNAFTSLGNFGQALNKKKTSKESIAMFSELFPDVSQRVLDKMSREDMLTLFKLKMG